MGRRYRRRKPPVRSSKRSTKPDWRTPSLRCLNMKQTISECTKTRLRWWPDMLSAPGRKMPFLRKNLLFVGALREDDSPNVDSLVWFIEQCWPAIRTAEPEIKLVVVGDNTAPSLNEINDKRIIFKGRRASIESFMTPAGFSLHRHASLPAFPTKSTRQRLMDCRQS